MTLDSTASAPRTFPNPLAFKAQMSAFQLNYFFFLPKANLYHLLLSKEKERERERTIWLQDRWSNQEFYIINDSVEG